MSCSIFRAPFAPATTVGASPANTLRSVNGIWIAGVGGNSSWIYQETLRDVLSSGIVGTTIGPGFLSCTVAHEIGHQLGLPHDEDVPTLSPIPTLMKSFPATSQDSSFSPMQIHMLRTRLAPYFTQ
jgi:hypothetical protein